MGKKTATIDAKVDNGNLIVKVLPKTYSLFISFPYGAVLENKEANVYGLFSSDAELLHWMWCLPSAQQKIKTRKMKQILPFPGEGWAELSSLMLSIPGTLPLQAIEHNLK